MRATMAAVVVLPFVAEISADPRGSQAASLSTAPGSSFQSNFPGTVVPPPAPTTRERAAAARASTISAESGRRGLTRRTLPRPASATHPFGGTFGVLTVPGDVAGAA
jgi:hypothetical protein